MVQVDGFFLLRGLGRTGAHWKSFSEQLKNEFPDKTVVVGDLPGAGAMSDTPCPLSVSKMADLVWLEYSDRLPTKIALIGMSLGGMVCTAIAEKFPGRVEALVLMNSSANTSRPWERMTFGALLTLIRSMADRDLEARESGVLDLICTDHIRGQAMLGAWVELAKKSPISIEQITRQLAAGALFRCPGKLSVQGMHLIGAGDRLVNPRAAERLSRELGFPSHIHPTAGHDISIDDPNWVIDQIKKLL